MEYKCKQIIEWILSILYKIPNVFIWIRQKLSYKSKELELINEKEKCIKQIVCIGNKLLKIINKCNNCQIKCETKCKEYIQYIQKTDLRKQIKSGNKIINTRNNIIIAQYEREMKIEMCDKHKTENEKNIIKYWILYDKSDNLQKLIEKKTK